MKQSIKFKVTFWYTCIITIVLFGILGGAIFYSEYYGVNDMQAEIKDEVVELMLEIDSNPEIVASREMELFYDDGIMLSVYNNEGEHVNGILPTEFPEDYVLKDNVRRTLEKEKEYWILFDRKLHLDNGEVWWIRGICTENYMVMFNNRLMLIMAFIIPVIIIIIAFLGYRMVSRVLTPVSTMTDTVNEISGTKDLSKRLPKIETKDEIAYLTDTFNKMLEIIEDSFEAEKQFTSDAAHELRTPIFVIIAHCEYCLEELNLDDETREEISIIYDKAKRMSKLVSQLLMMAKTENHTYTPVFEEVELRMLAESVIEELEEKAVDKKIQINLLCETDEIYMKGDQVLLTRMFINLIDNAISYGKQDGHVDVSIIKMDNEISISVKDDGIGIEEGEQDKIWNRFYRGDKSRTQTEGFGLGLFMVRWIVEIHGGAINVDSSLGKGTCFTIRF